MFEALVVKDEDEKFELPDFSGLFEDESKDPTPTHQTHLSFDALPVPMQQNLTMHYFNTGYNSASRIAVANIEHMNRIEELDHKARNADYLAEREEDRRLAKETETLSCFVGADGCIWAQITNPMKKEPRVFCIIECRGLMLTKLVSVTPSGRNVNVYWLRWDTRQDGIYIMENDFSEDILPDKLQHAGITLKTTRRTHASIVGKIIALLCHNSDQREIAFGFGWHRNLAGDWRFINKDEKTYMEALNYV